MGIIPDKKSNYPRGQYFDPNQWNTVSKEIIQKEDKLRETHPATLLQVNGSLVLTLERAAASLPLPLFLSLSLCF